MRLKDCLETFIETQKKWNCKILNTWLDNRHHETVEFLAFVVPKRLSCSLVF